MLSRRLVGFLVLSVAAILSACGRSESPAGGASSGATSAIKPPFGFLNTPPEGGSVKLDPQNPFFASGWALADSGVADVSAVFDDGQKAYVKTGFAFPGVKERFPSYADAEHAGYMFAIPKLPVGAHSVVVTVTARDGTTVRVERHFSVS
ncbi:MAG TPA: hypothetical protein VKJ00_14890 [Thermoanaerobaculia bacterium]|nr:hypothetical protein [Thermoanaerobaculia bacterium]